MKNTTKYLKLAVLLACTQIAKSQTTVFEKSFSDTQIGMTVLEDKDSNIWVIGSTVENTAGLTDFSIKKLDPMGEEIWSKTHGGFNNDVPSAAVLLADGSAVIVGYTGSFSSSASRDVYLIKMDTDGNIVWTSVIGGNRTDEGTCIKQTPDGGFILTALTESFGAGNLDAWLIKTDSLGEREWDKTFGGEEVDDAWSVDLTKDGGYILTGGTYSLASGTEDDLWLIKTDSNGDKDWIKTYGVENQLDWGWEVVTMNDGYVAVGLTDFTRGSGFSTGGAFFLRVDLEGNVKWEKNVSQGLHAQATCIARTDGDALLIGGIKWVSGIESSFWVTKLSGSGREIWDLDLGISNTSSRVNHVIQAHNGDVICSGYSDYTPSTNQVMHVVRIADPTSSISPQPDLSSTFRLFPNPANDQVTLDFDGPMEGNISIVNQLGQVLINQPINNQKQLSIEVTSLASGVYFMNIQSSTGNTTLKWTKT